MTATSTMRFGLSGSLGGLEAHSHAATLERAREVAQLGFAGMWFNEKHFGRPDLPHQRLILSPIVLAMAVAAATTLLRVGDQPIPYFVGNRPALPINPSPQVHPAVIQRVG